MSTRRLAVFRVERFLPVISGREILREEKFSAGRFVLGEPDDVVDCRKSQINREAERGERRRKRTLLLAARVEGLVGQARETRCVCGPPVRQAVALKSVPPSASRFLVEPLETFCERMVDDEADAGVVDSETEAGVGRDDDVLRVGSRTNERGTRGENSGRRERLTIFFDFHAS